jgi:hypothetical protein
MMQILRIRQCQIHFNIIFPNLYMASWPHYSFWVSHGNALCILFLPDACWQRKVGESMSCLVSVKIRDRKNKGRGRDNSQ